MVAIFDSTTALTNADAAIAAAVTIIDTASKKLAHASLVDGKISVAKLDVHQVLAYELAHGAAAVEGSKVMRSNACVRIHRGCVMGPWHAIAWPVRAMGVVDRRVGNGMAVR